MAFWHWSVWLMGRCLCAHSTNFISAHLVPSLLCGRGQNSSPPALLNYRSHTQAQLMPCKPLSEGAFLKVGFYFTSLSQAFSQIRRVWWQGQMTVVTPPFTVPLGPLSTAATPLELLVDNLPQSQSMTGPVLGHRNTKWPSKCDILHDEKLVSQAWGASLSY